MIDVLWADKILSVLRGSENEVLLPRLPLSRYDTFILGKGATRVELGRAPISKGIFWGSYNLGYNLGDKIFELSGNLWSKDFVKFEVLGG